MSKRKCSEIASSYGLVREYSMEYPGEKEDHWFLLRPQEPNRTGAYLNVSYEDTWDHLESEIDENNAIASGNSEDLPKYLESKGFVKSI
jgi:hypothetical protein